MTTLLDTTQAPRKAAPPPAPVRVNGKTISRAAIARETQHHPASHPGEAWAAAARALVIREVLAQEVARRGLRGEAQPDAAGRRETQEEADIRTLLETAVSVPAADTESCKRYHAQNPHRFMTPTLTEAAHILIPVPDEAARAGAREKGAALADVLAKEPASFAMLAKLHSACPSKEVGGSLGQISPGTTVPEFEAALAALKVGAIAAVESRYGVHVVRIDRRIGGDVLPFEAVESRIRTWLEARARQTAERHYLLQLLGGAKVEGVALDVSGSPLVQ
jgi:peptidyl-prolyl cis-trans isomerase C